MPFSVTDLVEFTGTIPSAYGSVPYLVNPGVVQSVSGSDYLVAWSDGSSSYLTASSIASYIPATPVSACCGSTVPGVLFMTENDRSKNMALFDNALLLYQSAPSSVSSIATTSGWFSQRQYPDYANATTFYYYLICNSGTSNYELYGAYPDLGGSPALSSLWYSWNPATSPNSCGGPFSMTVGTIGAGLDATETVSLSGPGGSFTPHVIHHPLVEDEGLQIRMRQCPFWIRCMTCVDRNYCSLGRGVDPGRPTFADCKSCLLNQDAGTIVLPPKP